MRPAVWNNLCRGAGVFLNLAILVALGACAELDLLSGPSSKTSGTAKTAKPKPSKPGAGRLGLTPVTFAQLSGWTKGSQEKALLPLLRSCAAFAKRPDAKLLRADGLGGKVGDWRLICTAAADQKLARTNRTAVRAFFEMWFRPLAVSDGEKGIGLFTGYFEPHLRGSWSKTAKYKFPLYRRPPELINVDLGRFRPALRGRGISGSVRGKRLVPFADRKAIRRGALAGRGLEFLWVDNEVDVFFLHVQGSGRVVMTDGSVVRVGFAGRNGLPYKSIGREMIKMGVLQRDKVSMQSIRQWLSANPLRAKDVMDRNKSYIFFSRIKGPGPVGAQGVALTPGRSLAVDRRYFPLGLPFWLDTSDPLDGSKPLRRLMIAQDTGGAITGPVRGDLFWGYGAEARERAGKMKSSGRYFILLPKFIAGAAPGS